RRGDRGPDRGEIDGAELGGLPGRGMRHPNQVEEGVAGRDAVGVGRGVEGAPDHHLTARGELALGAGPREGAHPVAARGQLRQQGASQVAGAAGDKDLVPAVGPAVLHFASHVYKSYTASSSLADERTVEPGFVV